MKNKPIFVTGPHNLGYYVAFAAWIACFLLATGQLFSEETFTVLAQKTECEQPLNNRCIYVFHIRESDGLERDAHFTAFQASAIDLAPGNSVEKHRFHFEYLVNGERVVWHEWSASLIASILALIPFGLARLLTPKRTP